MNKIGLKFRRSSDVKPTDFSIFFEVKAFEFRAPFLFRCSAVSSSPPMLQDDTKIEL